MPMTSRRRRRGAGAGPAAVAVAVARCCLLLVAAVAVVRASAAANDKGDGGDQARDGPAPHQRRRADAAPPSRGGADLVVQPKGSVTRFFAHRSWWQGLLDRLTQFRSPGRAPSPHQHPTRTAGSPLLSHDIFPDSHDNALLHRRVAHASRTADPLREEEEEEGDDDGRAAQPEAPHVGMRLRIAAPPEAEYELLEAVEYRLGDRSHRYAVDYAYRPVLGTTAAAAAAAEEDPAAAGRRPRLRAEDDDAEMSLVPAAAVGTVTEGAMALGTAAATGALSPPPPWWQQWCRPFLWRGAPDHDATRSASSHRSGKTARKDPLLDDYRMNHRAFAGGSHGEVWRGRRRRSPASQCFSEAKEERDRFEEQEQDDGALIFKRIKLEHGRGVLDAGLREIHFGQWLAQQASPHAELLTRYVDHFFRARRDGGWELWIVFQDAGPSLRSYLYTAVSMGEFMFYQPSELWTRIRTSISTRPKDAVSLERPGFAEVASVGRSLMRSVLRQVLEAAAFLHENGIVHRDIKPGNIMCLTSNLDMENGNADMGSASVKCVLGDLSSAWDDFSRDNLYSRSPSRLEQTDEYAPPEAIFGYIYRLAKPSIEPTFDSWSIGVLALEMLLGSPNVFSVDQRTTAILTHKLKKEGAADNDIQRALYLAALSQFCIFNPSQDTQQQEWPLRDGDPLHQYSMVKTRCTLHDFHRALLARDPLGFGFDSSIDTLLHLIWQLLSWDPKERISASDALKHPYFGTVDVLVSSDSMSDNVKALESQMLDPRMDFNHTDAVTEFRCPHCGRVFDDWNSCFTHARSRKHAQFCTYDRQSLPTCLHAHSMLPIHNMSGYCDIQGRRRTLEDFHSIHLTNDTFFYGIFDGHSGNLASKFVASSLHKKLEPRLTPILQPADGLLPPDWKVGVVRVVGDAFAEIHEEFLRASRLAPRKMDQSGTTATAVYVAPQAVVVASLGDSRAVLAAQRWQEPRQAFALSAVQLTKDHVASDPEEQAMVEARGGHVVVHNGVARVNGTLAISRSIGDAALSRYLSREPHVVALSSDEVAALCGPSPVSAPAATTAPRSCLLILASDGLWDTLGNQEAVELVVHALGASSPPPPSSSRAAEAGPEAPSLQRAAEALTQEAYVRGSRDNIGVAVIAL